MADTKLYVISCKNDFPPVTEYNIQVYKGYNYLPLSIKMKLDCYSPSMERIITSKNLLIFACYAEDPVEAMIKFWSMYMYGGIENGHG